MKAEIEAKFLDINQDRVREKLTQLGAGCEQPMRLTRRAIVDYPDWRLQTEKDAFLRVRDEGDKVTLTYKQFKSLSVDGAREIEITVGSFEDCVQLLEVVGLKVISMQESKRETWRLDSVEV